MRECSSMSSKILSSLSAINRITYGVTNLVPIAVTLNYFKVFSLNWKMLFFKAISATAIKFQLSLFSPFFYLRIF